MESNAVDRTGKRILSLLKKEPGIGKPEIAARLKCSLSTVYRRFRLLEAAGHLTFCGGKVKLSGKQSYVVLGSSRLKFVSVPEQALRMLPYLADDPGVSKESLAEKMECSLTTVYERLHLLEKAGYVKVGRKFVSVTGPAKKLLSPEPKLNFVFSNANPLSIYRDIYSYSFSSEREKADSQEIERISSWENTWVVIGGHSKGLIGVTARMIPDKPAESFDGPGLKQAGGRMSEGVKVVGKRGASDTFQVVSHYVKVRMGCAVGVLSRAEVGRLCGQAKGLLDRGFTREEIQEAIDRLNADQWYRDKKWGFKAIEKDVLHTRMVREKQVPKLQPLPDPMDKLLEEERRMKDAIFVRP